MRKTLVAAVFLLAGVAAASAQYASPVRLGPGPKGKSFSVSFPASVSAMPLDGRVLLVLSNDDSAEPRMQINDTPRSQMVFGVTVDGMKLVLNGQANDFVGKGLSGGEIDIRACGLAAKDSGQHVILGNVAMYGATSGSLFAAGRAGERFIGSD